MNKLPLLKAQSRYNIRIQASTQLDDFEHSVWRHIDKLFWCPITHKSRSQIVDKLKGIK